MTLLAPRMASVTFRLGILHTLSYNKGVKSLHLTNKPRFKLSVNKLLTRRLAACADCWLPSFIHVETPSPHPGTGRCTRASSSSTQRTLPAVSAAAAPAVNRLTGCKDSLRALTTPPKHPLLPSPHRM
jgi:hypothetical protein